MLVKLSQDLLFAVKTNAEYDAFVRQLSELSVEDLLIELKEDNSKKAFWLNVYNAYAQLLLKKNPKLFEDRSAFYAKNQIAIAGMYLSFNEIEHGILRKSKWMYGMGFINKWFVVQIEKKLRVEHLDNRIHFALNCGAASCPPIKFYETEKIDEQLDLASGAYLEGDVIVEKNKVKVPALFLWFIGDFGGMKEIRKFLIKHKIISVDNKSSIKFKNYDWSLSLSTYDK